MTLVTAAERAQGTLITPALCYDSLVLTYSGKG